MRLTRRFPFCTLQATLFFSSWLTDLLRDGVSQWKWKWTFSVRLSVLLRLILLGQFDDCRWSFYGSKKLFLCISSSFVTLTGAENLKFKFFQKKKNFRKEGEQRMTKIFKIAQREIFVNETEFFHGFSAATAVFFRECEAIEKICWSRAPNGNESLCSWPSNKKRRREISSVDGKYASLKFINKICLTHTQQRAQESSVSSTAAELQIMDTKNRRLKYPY